MSTIDNYAAYRAQQKQLLALLIRSKAVFQAVDMVGAVSTVSRLCDKLSTDCFKVLVLGEFKRGKSTFINALIGAEILPAFATPCTAVINEIKWGEQKKAVLFFQKPLPKSLPDTLPSDVKKHIETAEKKDVGPMEIPVQELEKYIVIPDPARDQSASVAESPFARVEISWPLDLCLNGIEIIDSPGLNEHMTRSRITTEYLSSVDAVVFVMSCHALASQSELHVIDCDVRAGGHEEIFFVCNRFDEIRSSERQRLVEYGKEKLREKTSFGADGIYFISATNALEGRMHSNADLVEQSGILPLESHLSNFLIQDRGKIKLLQPSRELTNNLNKATYESIPAQRHMLEQSLGQLEKQYEEIKPQLENAERKRRQIMEQVNKSRTRLRDDVRREIAARIRELATRVPRWVGEYEPKSKVEFVSLKNTKQSVEEMTREVSNYITLRLEEEQAQWQKESFQPFLMERLNDLGEGVRDNIQQLVEGIDQMSAAASGVESNAVLADQRTVGALERVMAAAGGYFLAGIGSALVGGALGYMEMLKSILPNIAVGIGVVFLVGWNPLILIPALLGAGTIQGIISAKTTTNRLKTRIGEELYNRLSGRAQEISEEVSMRFYDKTEAIALTIDEGISKEIAGIKENIESVLSAKRAGEERVRERVCQLGLMAGEIANIRGSLEDIIFSLVKSL